MKFDSARLIALAVGFCSMTASIHGFASTHDAAAAHVSQPATASASEAMSEGEIRKVDKSAGKITIKHGELKNLGMTPMTMVFRVKDPAMLDQVKPGDKVNFVADQVGGQLTVMKIERVQ